MVYKIVYLNSVYDDLRKIDKLEAKKILNRIESYLAKNPREVSSPLKGDFKGYWRYRYGDYRIIFKIADNEVLITILRIAHRKAAYN